jgi:hypothetical protein
MTLPTHDAPIKSSPKLDLTSTPPYTTSSLALMNSSSAPQHTSYLSTHVSKTSPLELGATLYTPATHPRLKEIISGELLPEARSLVLCTEDAISEGELTTAIDNIARALDEVDTVRSQCFIRPRNASTLKRVISLIDTRRFRGVVIPKVDNTTSCIMQKCSL